MKKSPGSLRNKTGETLDFPESPDFVSFPPRLTLEEYDRLNQEWKNFNPPRPESRIETGIREEFVLK